jgi:glucose-6-phosphate isomerase
MSTTRMATPLPNLNASDPAAQWQRFCDLLWHHEPLGLWLDVSRMAISAEQLQAFEQPFVQAFAAMDALEKGAIANPDEGRQVGHYWLRNPELAPDRSVGEHISAELRRLQGFGSDVLQGRLKASNGEPFTDVLWVGIGGSGLGPLLMIRALQENRQGLPFHFLDNVDPAGMSRLYDGLGDRLKTTLVIVVSKSGGTPEPHLGEVGP